ncbi:MAG: serine/threonine protein kinase [Planctomycetes bacterium]|nr:serine/threonine protein kinase [Planctomycetota bacterium]
MSAVDDFLRKVLRSRLLDREQLQATLRSLPRERREDVPAIANHLVAHRRLTRFQAYKLQQGITFGLTLGPYHILTPLGRGGMGTVYLALDTRTQRHVALKILPPKAARREERLLARFQREMELSQKVHHPHLAQTMEAGVYKNIHYIAMEYIPGQTLFRIVAAQGPLTVARAANLFAEVASALAQAHSQGVIHRDMKPSNIMVTPRDHAKVLDLGLAFTEGEEVEDVEVVGGRGYIVGSIDYMAPEQTRDPTNIDGRADLYALGCCLYFTLTGKPPFTEGTVHGKVKAHRHEEPAPIRAKNPQVPETFAAIVHKLLAKNPIDRFASANDLGAMLSSWRSGNEQPLDAPGDPEFDNAVQTLISAWTEPAIKEVTEDAVLFNAEPDEKPTAADPLSGSIFREIDRIDPQIWVFAILALFAGALFVCVLGTCALACLLPR